MKFKIKTNHLYLMLILIAIIIFACVGFNNKKSLEGFQINLIKLVYHLAKKKQNLMELITIKKNVEKVVIK
jgi:hypothetical protein